MPKSTNVLRKPAAMAGKERINLCRCNHPAAVHEDEKHGCTWCDCEGYRPRPCTCGHAESFHLKKCTAEGCGCRKFRQDQSPDFMLHLGVRAGEWQFITVPQLQFLMRPEQRDPTARIWACGMLHAIGQRQRLAVKTDKHGKVVPLQPADIASELNQFDALGRMSRQSVYREILELERLGAARKIGKEDGNGQIRLFFYAKPLRPRSNNRVAKSQSVVWPDYATSVNGTNNNHLRDAVIVPVRRALVKTLMRALREDLADQDDPVVPPDYAELIEETLQPVLAVVQAAYERLRSVVCPASTYKEDSICISSRQAGAGDDSGPAACMPAEPAPPAKLAGLRELFPEDHLDELALRLLDDRIEATAGTGYDREAFVRYVHRRARKSPIGTGLLFAPDGIAAEFCRKEAERASRRKADAARVQAAEQEHLAEMARESRRVLADPKASEQEQQYAREILASLEVSRA